jgi:hypothetical protein
MIRQLLGVISEFEKASLVAKLRGARERKKRATGKCEGRKSIAELRPDVVALARELRRRRPKPTLRATAAELAARGHLAGSGKPFEASVVARMVRGDKRPRAQGKALLGKQRVVIDERPSVGQLQMPLNAAYTNLKSAEPRLDKRTSLSVIESIAPSRITTSDPTCDIELESAA